MGVADSLDPMDSHWHWMAHDLRRLRQKEGISQARLGRVIGAAKQTVCNYEANERRLTEEQAKALDRRWDTGGHFQRLLMYARRAYDLNGRRQHLKYEAVASELRIFELAIVPGIFQTEEYTRALFTAARSRQIEKQVAQRLARQEILFRADPPDVWVMLDQAVLDRPIGGRRVMAAQLARILTLTEMPNMVVRVIPRSTGAYFGLMGAFKVLTLEQGDVAYVDALGSGRLVLDTAEVRTFGKGFEQIGAQALPEIPSRRLIERTMESLR
ncbi:Scr1 family TA system antitoxin-like transcriptional regulator [Spirillospora sp. NPDC048824]|uniref:helix-turn-helix domain-containing protein n=1 Tax=Spirillospora sp. NPDC048824 TaxID=3364526 RepID=UPI003719DEC8